MKTISDIKEKEDNAEQKQRIFDLADKIRETAGRESDRARGVGAKGPKESRQNEAHDVDEMVARHWIIGCTLLGSAAEQLVGAKKQELATLLVSLGALLCDKWTRERGAVDFANVKKEICESDEIRKISDNIEDDKRRQDFVRKIENLIDVLELSFLSEPFRRMLYFLCERAGNKVLASSLNRVSLDTTFKKLFLSAWLADLGSKEGVGMLRETIDKLPFAPLLRVIVSAHLLSRVYWSQWRTEERKALLDLAERNMKRLGYTLDKGKIQREIDSQ